MIIKSLKNLSIGHVNFQIFSKDSTAKCALWLVENIKIYASVLMLSKNIPVYISLFIASILKLGSVAGPVNQANGRLTFEDDLSS